MNRGSSLKFSLKRESRNWKLTTGGLLFCLMALSLAAHLLGRSVKAGGQERQPGRAAAQELLFTPKPAAINNLNAAPVAPAATITINSAADGLPAKDGQCTLREALLNANKNNQSGSTDCAAGGGADTITFDLPAGPQTINLTGALPSIADSLTISGPGASLLTVRRDTGGKYRIFDIPVSGLTIAISGLTIRDGWTSSQMLPVAERYGGGIFSESALTLTNCVLTNNIAEGGGGGLDLSGGAKGTLTGCTISNNLAAGEGGGGIIHYSGALTLTNCTVSGNTTNGTGGGILYSSYNTLAVINSTIANNTSATTSGGGIYNSSGGMITLRNTIIANNTLPNIKSSVGASQGYNLTSDEGGGFLNQSSDQINKKPLLAPLGNYGGSTPTHALLPGSPAINAGTNTSAPATDQRGVARLGAPDIGAFESRGFTLAVTRGNNQYTTVNDFFAEPLSVAVSSVFGEPVIGGLVAFGLPATGASAQITNNPAYIDADSEADAMIKANNQAGAYQVAAWLNGGNTVNFNLINTCFTINPTNPSLPVGVVGQSYTQTFTANGGKAPYAFSLGAGVLPNGLTLKADGALSGTPTAFGIFSLTIRATDANGCLGERPYTLVIATTLPSGVVGTQYNQSLQAGGGTSSYTLAVIDGSLPGGLTLTRSGSLFGTPGKSGTFYFTLEVTDANLVKSFATYKLIISPAPASLYPVELPDASQSSSYNQILSVADTNPPYTSGPYTFTTSDSLPAGLSLSPDGALTGAPSKTGVFTFTAQATYGGFALSSRTYTIQVFNSPSTDITPDSLPDGYLNVSYSQTLSAGGAQPFVVTKGPLPPGLTLSPSGALSGKPTAPGLFSFTVQAGAGSAAKKRPYKLMIPLPAGKVGIHYQQTLVIGAGAPPYHFILWEGVPPGGLTLTQSGSLSGKPAKSGTFDFTVLVTDALKVKCFASYRLITVDCPAGVDCTPGGINPGDGGYIPNPDGYTTPGSEFQAAIHRVAPPFDFDGDGKTDLSVWRLRERDWAIINSRDGSLRRVQWADDFDPLRDIIVHGDFDGDGKADPAVFRVTDGQWRIVQSSTGETINLNLADMTIGQFKSSETATEQSSYKAIIVPAPADYDGDGKTDIALFCDATGAWRIRRSSDGAIVSFVWGMSGDAPVPADYDGDGKADLAVFRPSTGAWHVLLSGDDQTMIKFWGSATDTPVPADYDGDGKADFSVWREADKTWYTLYSSDGSEHADYWETAENNDVPVPGDYDGVGKAEHALWHQNNGEWRIKPSNGSQENKLVHGSPGDNPIPGKKRW
jgi:parallel beta-helix repeat protein